MAKSFLLTSTAALVLFVGIFFVASSCTQQVTAAPSLNDWRGRRIYQVMTDRMMVTPGQPAVQTNDMNLRMGGTFKGLISILDYVANLGFDAMWISPVVKNVENITMNGVKYDGSAHGYWQDDINMVNPNYGTEADLLELVSEAKKRNIYIMIDFVLNHVGPVQPDTNFKNIVPFNTSSSYHKECQVTRYQCHTEEIHVCRLADLPDLDQDNSFVSQQLIDYATRLITTYKGSGLRLDTAMYVKENWLVKVYQALAAANGGGQEVFVTGEVYSTWACQESYLLAKQKAITSTLDYTMFDIVHSVYLSGGSMRQLGTHWRAVKALPHPHMQVNFISNQDNTRFLGDAHGNIAKFKSAWAHVFFQIGISCWFYADEARYTGSINGNQNRQPFFDSNGKFLGNPSSHMNMWVQNLNKAFVKFDMANPANDPEERWQDQSMYCFTRGKTLVCTSNNAPQTRTIPNLPFSHGQTICDFLDESKPCLQGSPKMSITVEADGLPRLFYAKN